MLDENRNLERDVCVCVCVCDTLAEKIVGYSIRLSGKCDFPFSTVTRTSSADTLG